MSPDTWTDPQLGTWTLEEFGALVTNAGYLDMGRLTRKTRHPAEQIEAVCAKLRRLGHPVYAKTAICPRCGRRAPLTRDGICKPCTYRQRLRDAHAAMARLLPRLPGGTRAMYARMDTETLDYVPPVLQHDAEPGESEEERAIAEAEAEARAVYRTLRAAQRRKERMEAKVANLEAVDALA